MVLSNNYISNSQRAKEALLNGIELTKSNVLLLQKIEELSLYVIELQEKIEVLEQQTKNLKP